MAGGAQGGGQSIDLSQISQFLNKQGMGQPQGGAQGGTRANMFGNPNQSINGYTPAGQPQGQQGSQPPQGSSPSGMQPPQNVYGMGGAQGPSAPTYGGSTNPTPYQGSAAPQNLGQIAGAYGQSAMGATGQTAQNALGAVSAPAGGGQNAMGPNIFGGGINPQGQGQNPANYQPPQEAIDKYEAWKADQNSGGAHQMNAMLDPRSPEAIQMQMMQANRAQQPQGQPAIQAGPSGAYGSGGAQGYAHSGAMQYNPQDQQAAVSAPAFTPQSPMGGFPQQPQGGGPDMSGMTPGSNMGYDQSGSDAGIGGQAVQGVQNPAGMGGKTSRAGGPYGGIMAGRPVMDKGEIPPSLSQMRPQVGGLQIQGNPTAQPFMRGQRLKQQQ